MSITKERALWIYNKMNEIRDFEETAYGLFEQNKLRGSVHSAPVRRQSPQRFALRSLKTII